MPSISMSWRGWWGGVGVVPDVRLKSGIIILIFNPKWDGSEINLEVFYCPNEKAMAWLRTIFRCGVSEPFVFRAVFDEYAKNLWDKPPEDRQAPINWHKVTSQFRRQIFGRDRETFLAASVWRGVWILSWRLFSLSTLLWFTTLSHNNINDSCWRRCKHPGL